MTDFRALCAELHAAFTTYAVDECHHNLLERARAALADEATSVAGNPTDEELLDLHDWMTNEWATNHDFELPPSQYARAVLARWGNPTPQLPASVAKEPRPTDQQLKTFACEWWHKFGFVKNKATCTWVIDEIAPEHFVDFMRSVLARWDNPTPQPVPISERLPEPKDCDEEGSCWVWWKNGVRWVLDEWTHHELREGPLSDYVSHWLPAHALPLPTAND